MTRDSNSAPSWPAPAQPQPPHNWRRLFLTGDVVRPKTMPLAEMAAPKNQPATSGMQNVRDIASHSESAVTTAQHAKTVQYRPSAVEAKLISALKLLGRATPEQLASVINRTPRWTLDKLSKLSAKQCVVGKSGPGGGYSVKAEWER